MDFYIIYFWGKKVHNYNLSYIISVFALKYMLTASRVVSTAKCVAPVYVV